jgi:hypothetical protein
MDTPSKFQDIKPYYSNKLKEIFAKYDDAVEPITEKVVRTQPLAPEDLPKAKVIVERWTVYSFTLPVHKTKKLAYGFATREEAHDYIKRVLTKKDEDGKIIQKTFKDGDNDYTVHYDTIRESSEQVDVYYNEPTITTVGNDKEDVLKEYLS